MIDLEEIELITEIRRLNALVEQARMAIQAQRDLSAMSKEVAWPYLPGNDPRFIPLLGPWDGFQAPEIRLQAFMVRRRDLQINFLKECNEISKAHQPHKSQDV